MLSSAVASLALMVWAFVLPTRSPERDGAVAATAAVARALGAPAGVRLAQDEGGDAASGVNVARGALLAGRFDEAILRFDEAIEASADAPDRIRDASALLSAHVTRAGLALARGELGRARALVDRLLRYDPAFVLAPADRTPQLTALFDEVRRRVGAQPTLEAADLGSACRRADLVLVGRSLGNGRVEILRFDRCRRTAGVIVPIASLDVEGAVRALGPVVPLDVPAARPTETSEGAARPRGLLIGGAVALGLGLALAVPALYFGVDAAQRRGGIYDGCTAATPCDASAPRAAIAAADGAALVAGVTGSLAVVAVATGAVLEGLAARARRRPPRASLGVSPAVRGAVLSIGGAL